MRPTVALWDKAPFIRLVVALSLGILLQWQLSFSLINLLISFFICLSGIIIYSRLSVQQKFRLSIVNGILVNIMIGSVGCILIWLQDIRHDPNWFGHKYHESDLILATINEPLVAKANSYKAIAVVQRINCGGALNDADGKIIIYFKKDSINSTLNYGNQILFRRPLSLVKNTGNPGSFDYRRYSLFQGITHQVYLTSSDYKILPGLHRKAFKSFIYDSRHWVVNTLKTYIPGAKEQGFAEAILIGYKDDLDKNLVQAYSNTGVVHIIAISGLHLGVIYLLLLFFLKPLKNRKHFNWIRLLVIICGLWLFSILAGAQPSVLRSALMFSCLAAGEAFSKKSSIYNNLALSAFVLLCFNPFWLWDVGFQLSYAAVLSIIVFFKPVYNWFYCTNKLLDFCWKTLAVTIAAQILTLPLGIFYFHQVPLLFLFTNFVAVPVSSLIVILEIILCGLTFIPFLGKLVAELLVQLIVFMNNYIEGINVIPFSTWSNLYINHVQVILLFLLITGVYYWLLEKKKSGLWFSLFSLLLFSSVQFANEIKASRQKQLVVYNVPKLTGIDLINGTSYSFIGDRQLLQDSFLISFNLQPNRTLKHLQKRNDSLSELHDFIFNQKHIVLFDSNLRYAPAPVREKIDIAILAKNPKLYISTLMNVFDIEQVVIDGSVPSWKARLWQHDCDSIHLRCYNVSEKGAFVMNFD